MKMKNWYDGRYLCVQPGEMRKIVDDGVRQTYWLSAHYTRNRSISAGLNPIWATEQGIVSGILNLTAESVDFNVDYSDCSADDDVDFRELFGIDHNFPNYDDDFLYGERENI